MPRWKCKASPKPRSPPGATQRHYHKQSEEFYFILEGRGLMEIDGETRESPGDAILIPPCLAPDHRTRKAAALPLLLRAALFA